MTLIETIDRLDKMILDRASISEQRALINSMREALEAHDKDKESRAEQIANFQAQYQTLYSEKAKADDKAAKLEAENVRLSNPPPGKNYGSQPRIKMRTEI